MTVIAAIVEQGRVLMGGDSHIADGDRVLRDTSGKVWKTPDMVIGASGSLNAADAVRYGFAFPDPAEESEDRYMRLTVPSALGVFLGERGLMREDESKNSRVDLNLLIGWRGRLWEIDQDLTTVETLEPFGAIGSGGTVARTALACLKDLLPPRERLDQALGLAARYAKNVSGPFAVLEGPDTDPGRPRRLRL